MDDIIGKYYGSEEYDNRESHIRMDNDGVYTVDFWKDYKLVESRRMDPDGIPRSLRYAEDAAENWVMGYIP